MSKWMRQSSMDDHLSNKRQYLYSLMKWIVTGFNNLDEVEDFYFREMLLSINPNIQLISRDALSDALMQQYQVIHYYVKRYISKRNFTITADTWTSVANQGYIALTAHFINDKMLGLLPFYWCAYCHRLQKQS